MATVYDLLPEGISDPPDLVDYVGSDRPNDVNAYFADVHDWEQTVSAWARENSKTPNSDLVGFVYRQGVADGKASYVVLSTRPLELIWLGGVGDDYRLAEAYERGLRVDDIRRAKAFEDAWDKLGQEQHGAADS